MTSSDGVTSSGVASLDIVAAAAEADDDDDDDDDDGVLMASLLCVGAAVCVTSLAVLVVLAVRRRLCGTGADVDKRVVVPVEAAQRLLAVAASATAPSQAITPHQDAYSYHVQHQQPNATGALYATGDKWTTAAAASHVTAMRLLITGHHQQSDLWAAPASSSDTCFV